MRTQPRKNPGPQHERRGLALVEFSLTLPLLLLLLVGSLEIGRGISLKHTVSEAARAGARVYSLRTQKTEADVRATIDRIMADAGIRKYSVTLDPTPSVRIQQLDALTVTVTADFDEATWYTAPWFLKGKTISALSVMPADLGESAADGVPVPFDDSGLYAEGDTNNVGEVSGTTDTKIKELEKAAAKAAKAAARARERADKALMKYHKELDRFNSLDPGNFKNKKKYEEKYEKGRKKVRQLKEEYEELLKLAIELEKIAEQALQDAVNASGGP